jgi:hypothetical protein
MSRQAALLVTLAMLGGAQQAAARTKLVTLPDREMIRMDLKNPAFTLIEEERPINLQRGVNRIDFSWANVNIDKDSIQFRCIESPGKVAVLNANFPPNENALFWEVSSAKAGVGVFRISYLLSNIQREISYLAVVDRAEKTMSFSTYMKLKNFSGERLERCDIRLGYGREFKKSIAHAESKKMLTARFKGVPVDKRYVFDPASAGAHVRMLYRLQNDKPLGMGLFPLERGKARIYQIDSEDTQAFLGEDMGEHTSVGRSMGLFLGLAKDVTVKRHVFREDHVNRRGQVYDIERELRFEVQNFKSKPVSLTLKEHPGGEWVVKSVVLKEERGERNDKSLKVVPHASKVEFARVSTDQLDMFFKVPPTKGDLKYQLHVTVVLKNRW